MREGLGDERKRQGEPPRTCRFPPGGKFSLQLFFSSQPTTKSQRISIDHHHQNQQNVL